MGGTHSRKILLKSYSCPSVVKNESAEAFGTDSGARQIAGSDAIFRNVCVIPVALALTTEEMQ